MRRLSSIVPVAVAALVTVGCAREPSTAPAAPVTTAAPEAHKEPAKPAETTAAALKEIDLSVWGPAWKGYVAMAPASTKVTTDGSSRHMTISEARSRPTVPAAT
jgi:hypothetical protein